MLHQAQLRSHALIGVALAIAMLGASRSSFASSGPTVTPADATVLQKAIAADKGKVVFVNFWATWCGPCVAEFPSIVKLDRAYRSKGLAVITVSADLPDQLETGVKPFLVKHQATFPQYIMQGGDPEVVINSFDKTWQGDLPRTFVYDRSGRLIKTFEGGQSYQQFAAAVKPLLMKRMRSASL